MAELGSPWLGLGFLGLGSRNWAIVALSLPGTYLHVGAELLQTDQHGKVRMS